MKGEPIDYATPTLASKRRSIAPWLGVAACLSGVAATSLPLSHVLGLLKYAPGSDVSFFSLEAGAELGVAMAMLITFPLAVLCFVLGWRARLGRRLALLAIGLAGGGLLLVYGLCQWIVWSRQLVPRYD